VAEKNGSLQGPSMHWHLVVIEEYDRDVGIFAHESVNGSEGAAFVGGTVLRVAVYSAGALSVYSKAEVPSYIRQTYRR
jgi:hypothetical protein